MTKLLERDPKLSGDNFLKSFVFLCSPQKSVNLDPLESKEFTFEIRNDLRKLCRPKNLKLLERDSKLLGEK